MRNKKSMNHQKKKRKNDPSSLAAKNVPPLLKDGEQIRERYQVDFMIGGGGFGQIFKGTDTVNGEHLAIKVEPPEKDGRRIKAEFLVLAMLRGRSHIPKLQASGTIRGCSFIVMTLLGMNLNDLRKKQKTQKFSRGTVYRLGQQLTVALRHVHSNGYVHRDVKPSNVCIGLPPKENVIYLVDFGMVRRFHDREGNLRRARDHAGFRGTMRYAALAVHQRKETGPADDFLGLLYTMIELGDGSLPWTKAKTAEQVEHLKETLSMVILCKNQPKQLTVFAEYLGTLQWDQSPDYEWIQETFQSCAGSGVTDATPFDWEDKD